MNQTLFLALVAGAVVLTASASADETTGTSQQGMAEIEQLKQQMAAMETRHDAEIAALRNENGDKWLTQQRADEIREVVKDVLADSETRSSLQGDGATAGWNKGFFLASPDGNFKLLINGQIQARFAYNYQPTSSRNPATTNQSQSNEYGTELRRVKLGFAGNIIDPSWTYLIKMAFNQNALVVGGDQTTTDGAVLEDAFIRKELGNVFAIKSGQWKSNYNYEESTSSSAQQFAERSVINQYFSTKFIQGIELQYEAANWKATVNYNDGGGNRNVGVVSTASAGDNNVEWATAGRVDLKLAGEWKQFKEMMSFRGSDDGMQIGVAYNWQRGGGTNATNPAFIGNSDGMNFSYTADFNGRFNGASFFAAFLGNSFYSRPGSAEAVGSYGAVVQGGYFLNDDVELIGRWEWLDVKGGTTSNNTVASAINAQHFSIYTVGANYYISKNAVKLTADAGYVSGAILFANGLYQQSINGADYRTDQTSDATGQVVARIQLQLLF